MLGIVCALKCEAESLIELFDLKSFSQKTSFPVYFSDCIFLIVSGIGKINAAAATCYLHLLMGERTISSWLNIGLGGHAFLKIGEGRLAHQIKEESGTAVFYPMPSSLKVKTETFLTVDKVETTYSKPVIYEMEASGFYQTALHFSTAELIHCYKVISDNSENPPIKNPQLASDLIKGNHKHISHICEVLLAFTKNLSDAHNVLPYIQPFMEKWRFTATEGHVLRRLIHRWRACYAEKDIWDEQLKNLKKAKEVLTYLDFKIENSL